MTRLDWAIIALYFVFAAGIGVAMSRRAGSSITEYFIGGRYRWALAALVAGGDVDGRLARGDVLVTSATRPEEDAVLRAFYLRVRSFSAPPAGVS